MTLSRNSHRSLYLSLTDRGSTSKVYNWPVWMVSIVFSVGDMQIELDDSERFSEVLVLEDFASIGASLPMCQSQIWKVKVVRIT